MNLTFDQAGPRGGYAPLKPIAKAFAMPRFVENAVVVLMDEEYPLVIKFALDINTMEMSFTYQGAVQFNMQEVLGVTAVLDIGASGVLTENGDFIGAFAIR